MRFKILALFCFFLTGCATGWYRPDTTESEFYRDRYECQQQAAQMYPVMIIKRVIHPGYQAPAQTDCTSYGNQVSCTTTPGAHTPPITTTEDANLSNRNNASSACLNSRGYKFKMEFK